MNTKTTTKLRATARPVFEIVASRLAVDTDVLAYLFGECLQEILQEAETHGACTLRGHGKFLRTTLGDLDQAKQPHDSVLTLFERTSYNAPNRPFKTLKLQSRMDR